MPCFYHHPPAALAARFSHGNYDYVFLSLRAVDYGVIIGNADASLRIVEIEEPQPITHRLKLRMSGSFDPVPHMIAWLEALTCGVQSATWSFDGEGPDYEVTSTFNQLVIVDCGEEVLRVSLPRERLIQALYFALRRFGESRRYRREDWELSSGMRRGTPLGTVRSALVESYIARLYMAPERPRWDNWAIPPWLRE